MTGTTIGNYRLLRLLGEGGMGIVYQAEHLSMGRPAAVKILRPELASNEEAVRRFFNEARATNEIRHPGIVQIYDCGKTAGAPWLIMELLDGESLTARLKRGLLSSSSAADLGAQAASVLGAAHAAGIVHRDLKPDNLFIVRDPDVAGGERVKVLDFGIAKLGASAGGDLAMRTRTGVLMGTPVYMSPEQCRGNKQVDARSDVYSMGVILYQMLAGHPPFVSDGIGELFDMHMNLPPPPLEHENPSVGAKLVRVVHKALEKDPVDRQQTMAELQRTLIEADTLGSAAPASRGRIRSPLALSSKTVREPASSTTLSASAIGLEASQPRPRGSRLLLPGLGGIVLAGGVLAVLLLGRGLPHQAPPSAAVGDVPAQGALTSAAGAPAAPARPAVHSGVGVPTELNREPVSPRMALRAERPADRDIKERAVVSLKVISSPPAARVIDVQTGQVLGVTPLDQPVELVPAGLKIRIEKSGFLSKSASIPPGQDYRESFRLEKVSKASPPVIGTERIIKL